MHCFSSSVEILKEVLKLGAYISIAGPVTFKNARSLIDVAKLVPEDKLMVETDCPYLSPEPNRGKRNDSSNLPLVCKKLAEYKNMDEEQVSKIVYDNSCKFFKITP